MGDAYCSRASRAAPHAHVALMLHAAADICCDDREDTRYTLRRVCQRGSTISPTVRSNIQLFQYEDIFISLHTQSPEDDDVDVVFARH